MNHVFDRKEFVAGADPRLVSGTEQMVPGAIYSVVLLNRDAEFPRLDGRDEPAPRDPRYPIIEVSSVPDFDGPGRAVIGGPQAGGVRIPASPEPDAVVPAEPPRAEPRRRRREGLRLGEPRPRGVSRNPTGQALGDVQRSKFEARLREAFPDLREDRTDLTPIQVGDYRISDPAEVARIRAALADLLATDVNARGNPRVPPPMAALLLALLPRGAAMMYTGLVK
jgi:hypothetical protein